MCYYFSKSRSVSSDREKYLAGQKQTTPERSVDKDSAERMVRGDWEEAEENSMLIAALRQ